MYVFKPSIAYIFESEGEDEGGEEGEDQEEDDYGGGASFEMIYFPYLGSTLCAWKQGGEVFRQYCFFLYPSIETRKLVKARQAPNPLLFSFPPFHCAQGCNNGEPRNNKARPTNEPICA